MRISFLKNYCLALSGVILFLLFAENLPAQNKIDIRLSAKPYRDTSVVKKKKVKKKKSEGSVTVTDTVMRPQEARPVISPVTMEEQNQKEEMILQDTLEEITPDEMARQLMESGDLNMKGSNFAQAIVYYDKVVSQYSTTSSYPAALLSRARAKMSLNDTGGALNDVTLFLRANNCDTGSCAEGYYLRGNIYFNYAKYESAIADFNEAVKDTSFKNYKYCFFYRALCQGELNKNIECVKDFTKFLSLDNYRTLSSAEALYYRGFYKVKLEDNRGAIKDYDKAIELYKLAVESATEKRDVYLQKLIDTYVTRALAKAEIKKYDEAIADYEEVIKLSPSYATAFRLKGLAEIGKGDLDSGCLDLSKAGEMGSIEAYEDIKHHCK